MLFQETEILILHYANNTIADEITSMSFKLRVGKYEVRQDWDSLTSRKMPGLNVSYSEGKKKIHAWCRDSLLERSKKKERSKKIIEESKIENDMQ